MDISIVGKFFQSEKILNYMPTERKFLNNIFFEKIDFTPITPLAILNKKAKLTDLISNINAGGNLHLLMSEKLSKIIKYSRIEGMQFFPSSIILHNKHLINNYFSLNMYMDNNNFIDIENSTIVHHKKSDNYKFTFSTEKEFKQFKDFKSFYSALEMAKSNDETFYIDKIKLYEDIHEDFFMLKNVEGGVKYIVSEKLKKEIEDAGCTGIEFQPIELSLSEWLAPGGPREQIYGKA